MGIISTIVTELAHKATEFGKMMQNIGHFAVQGH